MRKNVNGITLVALVITIIVLLILAGVTLSLTLGENGLLKRAEESKLAHEAGANNDVNIMEQATDYMNQYLGTNNSKEVTFTIEASELLEFVGGSWTVPYGTTWNEFIVNTFASSNRWFKENGSNYILYFERDNPSCLW